jgi:peptidyl-prolyl cis-trans isomerase SurA
MKKNIEYCLITLLLSVFTFIGCNSGKNVAEVEGEKITKSEFEKKFLLKCNNDYEIAKSKSYDEKMSFLNDLIDQRLRYIDGLNKKLDTTSEYKEKMDIAHDAALTTLVLTKNVIDPNLKKYYDILSYDYLAQHILLGLPVNPEGPDSIKTYNRAAEIIQRLKNGEEFSELAKKYSTDVATKSTGGILGFIYLGQTIPSFEYALFNLKENEFTETPLRTQLGLHIIKLIKKIPHFDSVRVSHILIKDVIKPDGTKDTITSFNQLEEIFNRAQKGEDFAMLAKQYSQDESTKENGGDLGYFIKGTHIPEFDNKAFELEKGSVSGAIRSDIGWHILKVTDKSPFPPFEKIKENIRNKYYFSNFYKKAYSDYIEELKKKFNLNVKPEAVDIITNSVDTSKIFLVINPKATFTEDILNKEIASFTGGKVTVKDFVQYISSSSSSATIALNRNNIINLIMASCEKPILVAEAKLEGLDNSDDYFESLNAYKINAILDIHNRTVIQPLVSVNEDEIEKYYNENKNQFIATDKGISRQKTFEESKDEITVKLKAKKLKDVLTFYNSQLRESANIKINESALKSTFSD